MVGVWCFGCCQAHRGLPVGFLLLQYSVLWTVESFSLLYLHFISLFICFRRWYIAKPGVFRANQYLSWSTSELRVRLAPWNRFKPSSNICLLTVSRRYFFCGSFVFFVYCVLHPSTSVHCCLVVTCWEMADLLALVGDVYCIFATFPCGILGQVWYLIVSFPDLYLLFTFILNIYAHIVLLCTFRFTRVSSVYEELLPFDWLNFNDLFRPQPYIGNQRIEFHENYTEYIWICFGYTFEFSSGSHQL